MGPLADGPLLFDHGKSAGLEQGLAADATPTDFRSPGAFRRRRASMITNQRSVHIDLAPIFRIGLFQQWNLDDAAALRAGSALAGQIGAQADFLIAKRALEIDGLATRGRGGRWR